MTYEIINPATGKPIKSIKQQTDEEISEAIELADKTFKEWKQRSFYDRSKLLTKLGELLRERKEELAETMTLEMGKPVKDGIAEIEKCALVCDYYAENAAEFLSEQQMESDASESFITYNPLGVILAVMPWNFPFWQVMRFAAPALMAGNVGLLKHASNVPRCALRIEELILEAGFPEGAFQTLLIGSDQVGPIIDDRRVRAVTLTGSTGAGRAVASRAGQNVKRSLLELGGSDPFIVMPSADLETTVAEAVAAREIRRATCRGNVETL